MTCREPPFLNCSSFYLYSSYFCPSPLLSGRRCVHRFSPSHSRAVTQCLSYQRGGPARDSQSHYLPVQQFRPTLSSALEALAWTDDWNSSSPKPHSPPTSPPGTLADTQGYDYKHHLFSRLTYPGSYSSPPKTK